jgi:4-amino-4-deoxy-L-arabinose transferase-like glycosyltransferase
MDSTLAGRTRAATSRLEGVTALLWILLAGALVRVVFFLLFHHVGLYTDEVQYQEIAVNLAEGRGFMMEDRLTSWRPPLYPFALSVLYRMAGTTDPDVARVAQSILSLGTVVVVYLLARTVFGARVAPLAAAIMAFYPSLLFYNVHILSEVLFIFLGAVTAWGLAAYLQAPRLSMLVVAGVGLGLSVLTRDIVWPTVVLMIALMKFRTGLSWRRWAAHSAVLLAVFLALTVPWVVRNTRVQGTFTLIATNGGMVFLAGNYEHTPADRPWRANTLDPAFKVRYLFPQDLSEGVTQKLAVRRALAFIAEHPWLTIRNGVLRAANVWGLEREVIGVFLKGTYGAVRAPAVVAVTVAIFTGYVLVVLAGLAGLWYALSRGGPAMGAHLYFAALIAFVTAVHAPVSGHPRYHLPLIPLFAAYAAQAWAIRGQLWASRRSWPMVAASACAGLLVIVWAREILFVELGRYLRALGWA